MLAAVVPNARGKLVRSDSEEMQAVGMPRINNQSFAAPALGIPQAGSLIVANGCLEHALNSVDFRFGHEPVPKRRA